MEEFDVRKDDRYRIMQLFMGHTGQIYETFASLGDGNLYCTCPGFFARKKCKHTDYINSVQENEGVFTMKHDSDTPDEIMEAFASNVTFRHWMLKHGEVAYI